MIESFKIPSATFPTLTGSIVTFNSQYAGLPLKSHKIALTATQSGSGTPSPSNPRPITGYSAINISHSDADTSNPTVYTIQIGSTVYGGEYDARTGVFTVTYELYRVTSVSSVGTQGGRYFFRHSIPAASTSIVMTAANLDDYKSETYYPDLSHALGSFVVTSVGTSIHLTPEDQTIDTVVKMNTYLADNPAVFVIPLAESLRQTIQLPPCPIDTTGVGVQNIWADTGDTTLQYPKFG